MDNATVKKIIWERRAMNRARKVCDEQNLPYPAELCEWLLSLAVVCGN